MPSLNLDLDYFDHPKTRRLVVLLGPGAEILPIRLWTYCGKFHPKDGSLVGYSEDEIEKFSGWAGMKGLLYKALLSLGFLDTVEGGVIIHDWDEHAGHFAVYHERAKQAAKARWNGHSDASSRKTNAYSICNSIENATVSPKNDASSRKTNAPAGQGNVLRTARAPRVAPAHVRIFSEEATRAGITPVIDSPDAVKLAAAFKACGSDEGKYRIAIARYFSLKDKFIVESGYAGRMVMSRLQLLLSAPGAAAGINEDANERLHQMALQAGNGR